MKRYAINTLTKEHHLLGPDEIVMGPDWVEVEADDDGWIMYDGGGCPVTEGTLVDVRYLGDGILPERLALDPNFLPQGYWSDDGIAGYRPVLDLPDDIVTPSLKPGDTYINKCNDETLKVIALDGKVAWVRPVDGVGDKFALVRDLKRLPSQREKAIKEREKAIKELEEVIFSTLSWDTPAVIYDAIESGKIPGIKLEEEQ